MTEDRPPKQEYAHYKDEDTEEWVTRRMPGPRQEHVRRGPKPKGPVRKGPTLLCTCSHVRQSHTVHVQFGHIPALRLRYRGQCTEGCECTWFVPQKNQRLPEEKAAKKRAQTLSQERKRPKYYDRIKW